MGMDLQEIKNILGSKKDYFRKKYGVSEMAVFGSYTRDDHTEKSDVDVMVSFNRRIGLRFVDLAFEMEDLLGKKVDLVTRNALERRQRLYKYIKEDIQYV